MRAASPDRQERRARQRGWTARATAVRRRRCCGRPRTSSPWRVRCSPALAPCAGEATRHPAIEPATPGAGPELRVGLRCHTGGSAPPNRAAPPGKAARPTGLRRPARLRARQNRAPTGRTPGKAARLTGLRRPTGVRCPAGAHRPAGARLSAGRAARQSRAVRQSRLASGPLEPRYGTAPTTDGQPSAAVDNPVPCGQLAPNGSCSPRNVGARAYAGSPGAGGRPYFSGSCSSVTHAEQSPIASRYTSRL